MARVVHCESAMWLGMHKIEGVGGAQEVREMFTYSAFRKEALKS